MTPAKDTHTPTRPVRVESELWDEFGEAAGERNRSEVLRQFMAWYCRRPDAKLPKRPVASRAD
jgi:hypothetical protein